MNLIDGRKLDHKTREERRISAVRRIQSGASPEDIAYELGTHRSCVYDWIKRYKKNGEEGLLFQGISGRKKMINESAKKKLCQVINEHCTNNADPNLDYDKFSKLLDKYFGINLSNSTIRRVIHQLNIYPNYQLLKSYEYFMSELMTHKKICFFCI